MDEFFNILLVGLVLFCLIGAVSASENMTESQLMDDENLGCLNEDDSLGVNACELINGFDEDDSLGVSDCELMGDDEKHTDMYVNCSKEENGDGLSPETAFNYKSLSFYPNDFPNLANNGTIHLSEGSYEISRSSAPEIEDNTSINIMGQEGTVITHCWYDGMSRLNSNRTVTFINICFDVPSNEDFQFFTVKDNAIYEDIIHYGISLGSDSADFNFINCTFVNTSFVMSEYEHEAPNRDGLTDICSVIFENCKFLNYTYDSNVSSYDVTTSWGDVIPTKEYETTSMFTAFECSMFVFNNCIFDNICCDAIVDSYGGHVDNIGRFDGVYIYNSTFTNCGINGVVKTRQISSCAISNCTYDFPVRSDIPLVGPFYINSTDKSVIKTNLDVLANANTLIITLTDEFNKPMVDYEVEIVTNGRVSYEYTDSSGKIILNNLLGNYSFEISYPGDEYVGYAPCKVFRNFTFAKSKLATALAAPKVTATYNVAKNLVITLKDSNGKTLANKKVSVKVGSISKTFTTNSKGQASLNVATLVPKTYTAKVSFNEDDDYKGSSLSVKVVVSKGVTKLVAKAKTFKVKTKTKKFYVTLKDSKNKALKGKKLSIKVNGKTYTAKTNKKGVATFKITKLSKKGTFKSKISFKGDKWYKAISKTVKIKVKQGFLSYFFYFILFIHCIMT